MYKYLFLILFFPVAINAIQLDEAITYSMQNNPKVKAAEYDFLSKREQNGQVVSAFLPMVNASFAHNLQKDNLRPDTASLTVNQQVFNFGGDLASIYKANKAIAAAKAAFLFTKQQIALEVVKSYVGIIEKQELVKLYRHNIKMLERNLAASKQRYELGETTKTVLAKAESSVSKAQSEQIKVDGELNNAQANYLHVIGLEAEDLDEPTADSLHTAISLAAALELSYANNLQIISSSLMCESAKYASREALAKLFPAVSLGFTMTEQRLPNSTQYHASFGLNTSIALFRGSADYMKVRQANYTVEQYHYNHHEVMNAVKEAVTTAWNNFITMKAMLVSAEKEVDSLSIVLKSVKEEEKLNIKIDLDVIEANNGLLKAKVRYLGTKMQYIIALYNLMILTSDTEVLFK